MSFNDTPQQPVQPASSRTARSCLPRTPILPDSHIAPAALPVHFPSSRVAAPAAYRGTAASSGRPFLRQAQDRPFDTRPLARSLLRTREWRGAEGRKSPCSKAGRRRIPASMRCVHAVGPRSGVDPGPQATRPGSTGPRLALRASGATKRERGGPQAGRGQSGRTERRQHSPPPPAGKTAPVHRIRPAAGAAVSPPPSPSGHRHAGARSAAGSRSSP